MVQNKNIRIKAKINIFIYKDENSYIVYSPALDLTDYGATSSIALKAFRKSLKIYFEETTRMATLEKDLLDHGWKLQILTINEQIDDFYKGNKIKTINIP